MDELARISLLASFSLVITMGLIGNSLVILIIAKNKFLRRTKPINIVLLNLAVADSTVLIFLAPRHVFFGLINPHPTGIAGDMLCKFVTGGNIAWIGAITSICSLLIIAAERYYAVCLPHQYSRKFSRKLVRNLSIIAWIYGLIFCLPLFFVVQFNKQINFCFEDWGLKTVSQGYAVLWVFTAGLIPAFVMIFFYSNVIFALWIKKGEASEGKLMIRQFRQKTRKRVSKALFVISFLYCASWFPPLTNYILVYFETSHGFSNVAYLASVVMVAFNSSVNPVIYAFYSGLFRKHLKNLIVQVLVPRKINALDNARPASATNGLTVNINDIHAVPTVKTLGFSDILIEENSQFKDDIQKNEENNGRSTPMGLMPLQ